MRPLQPHPPFARLIGLLDKVVRRRFERIRRENDARNRQMLTGLARAERTS